MLFVLKSFLRAILRVLERFGFFCSKKPPHGKNASEGEGGLGGGGVEVRCK